MKSFKIRLKLKLFVALIVPVMTLSLLLPAGNVTVFAANSCAYLAVSGQDYGDRIGGHIKFVSSSSYDFYEPGDDGKWISHVSRIGSIVAGTVKFPDSPSVGAWYHLDLSDSLNPKYVKCSNQSDAAHPGLVVAGCSLHGDVDHFKYEDNIIEGTINKYSGTYYDDAGGSYPWDLEYYNFPTNETPDKFYPDQYWFYSGEEGFVPCNGKHFDSPEEPDNNDNKPTPVETPVPASPAPVTSPKTGDSSNAYAWVTLLVASMGIMTFAKKRSKV